MPNVTAKKWFSNRGKASAESAILLNLTRIVSSEASEDELRSEWFK